jgi:membrane protein DedA with SNARE-associated domain
VTSLVAAGSTVVPSVLNELPTALAVAVLCVAVAVEIIAIPGMLLPGATVTLIAGALIGAGRPALAVVIPMVVAVAGADQLAYFSGAFLIDWWRRRRPARAEEQPAVRRVEREISELSAAKLTGTTLTAATLTSTTLAGTAQERPVKRGRAATWLTAAMPSVAGAARMPYRTFALRLLVMRGPWLALALSAGTLAAKWLAQIGHVAGVGGLLASAIVVGCLLVARHRPGAARVLSRGTAAFRRR